MPITIVKHNRVKTQVVSIKVVTNNAITTDHKAAISNVVATSSVAVINNAATSSVAVISNAATSSAITTVLSKVVTTSVTHSRVRVSSKKVTATSSAPTTVHSRVVTSNAVAISSATIASKAAISSVAVTSNAVATATAISAVVTKCRVHAHRCVSLPAHNALSMRSQ